MGFKVNLSEAAQGGVKPEGYYECIIASIEGKTAKSGRSGLNFTYVIRNDVSSQKYGNACLFDTMWQKNDPSELDKQVEGYSFARLMGIGKAAGLTDGKDYADLTAYCKDLIGKCVLVELRHESNPEYQNGAVQERVRSISRTNHPDCKHKYKKAPASHQPSYQQVPTSYQPAYSDYPEAPDNSDSDGVPF